MKKLYLLAAVMALLAGGYVFAVANIDGHILRIGGTRTPIATDLPILTLPPGTFPSCYDTMPTEIWENACLPPAVATKNAATLTPTPTTPTYNIVLLGGDQTAARAVRGERLDGYQHTDVFVIVHMEMSDPPRATAILVPRNLWVPDSMMIDEGAGPFQIHPLWSMEVYGRTGAMGIDEYVRRTFGLPVDAVFYVRMDRFPELIDKYLGGLSVDVHPLNPAKGPEQVVHMSGAEVLAYLRDNDNNWGCLEYDCEGRVFRVLDAFREKALGLSLIDELSLVGASVPEWTSDVPFSRVYDLTMAGSEFIRQHGTVKYVRLWTPEIQRADTPLDVRGMVPTIPLYTWIKTVLP